jgi:hypothetical protein
MRGFRVRVPTGSQKNRIVPKGKKVKGTLQVKRCPANAPLAQLVQSISFTPRGSEVRILQGAQYGVCSSEEEHLIVVQDVVGSSPISHPKEE